MGENGSQPGVRALSTDWSHEHFEELCALSTSGILTAEEWVELEEHLGGCGKCRKAKREYEELVASTIPVMAPEEVSAGVGTVPDPLPPVAAEYALLERLEAETESDDLDVAPEPLPIYRWDRWWRWGAAAAVLLAACGTTYWAGLREGRQGVRQSPTVATARNSQVSPSQPQISAVPKPLVSGEKRVEPSAMQAEVRADQLEVARLRQQTAQLETKVTRQGADLGRSAEERAELGRELAAAQTSLQAAENKLNLSTQQSDREMAQFVDQQSKITELSASLRERDQKVAEEEQLLEHDRDIRNLMGARDLYIAEIYDVAKNGDTQKPFGRVFYTKGKSLVFYAYDLDQQPGVKRASTFQAWGRTASDPRHDRNLGIFYQDNVNKQRWVLKSDDAKTLSQIDAVFVTVEPNGESVKPSGKPLLFTYLRMTPNHP
jgi:hypothetical protein